LALNIINEKIFIFLWFWFIALATATGLAILLNFAVITMPSIRETVIKRKFKPANNANR
jgi:hypothetical protein